MPARLALLLALASPLAAQDGKQLFTTYCSVCHGPDGKGATGGAFPPLAGSPWVAGDAALPIKLVLKGLTGPVEVLGKSYNLEMPPQGAVLDDGQLAAIFTYVRSSWGNQAPEVTADFVKTVRASVADRSALWTAPEILKLHPLPLGKTALSNVISQTYAGEWSTLPDFSKLTATNVEEEHNGVISEKDSPLEDDFAIVWKGDFTAPANGVFEFYLDVDDAAVVSIGGKNVVAVGGSGPLNGSRARQGRIKLSAGAHPIRIEYLEIKGGQAIVLGWRRKGTKEWKWLSERTANPEARLKPILVEPENGRPVIYRNFITGTTPRAIGVGFPGGLNFAYSADHLAPELLWTGEFIDGAKKWIERGTDNSPPAGENVVRPTQDRALPEEARFKGYKLDSGGNPTFFVKLGGGMLSESWKHGSGGLVRTLDVTGDAIEMLIVQNAAGFEYTAGSGSSPCRLQARDSAIKGSFLMTSQQELELRDGKRYLKLEPGKPVTLTYQWKL